MKTLVTIASMLLSAGSALARDQGIINQAGMYEKSMAVYLHPAGYFFEVEEAVSTVSKNVDHPALQVRQQANMRNVFVSDAQHPALDKSLDRPLISRTYR